MHWNIHGEVDRWSSTRAEVLILPLIGLRNGCAVARFAQARSETAEDASEKRSHEFRVAGPLRRFRGLCLTRFLFDQLTTAFGYSIADGRVMTACLLVFFAILGNYLGTMRPNYFVGLRTPWTLESAATWRATHRLGGQLMFFGALFLLVLDFFLSQSVCRLSFCEFPAAVLRLGHLSIPGINFRTNGAVRETL